jgi:hypothetical protein
MVTRIFIIYGITARSYLTSIEFVLNFTDQYGNKLDLATTGMPPGIPKEVPHVITFVTLQNGHTEITVTEYGYTTRQVHNISKMGLEQCLDKMEDSFKNRFNGKDHN